MPLTTLDSERPGGAIRIMDCRDRSTDSAVRPHDLPLTQCPQALVRNATTSAMSSGVPGRTQRLLWFTPPAGTDAVEQLELPSVIEIQRLHERS